MNNTITPSIIVEQVQNGPLFTKPEDVKRLKDGKIVFKAYLQEADSNNNNKRVYKKETLDKGMRRIDEKIKKRALIGELDHPISSEQVRKTTVMYKEGSHIIREWGWEDNLLTGIIETTPYTPNGKSMTGYILDGVPIGFSLRGLADLEDMGRYQLVLDPLIIITYDCVSEPSHSKSVIQEIRQESLIRVIQESKHTVTCSNGRCYLNNYFDELVETGILQLQKYL